MLRLGWRVCRPNAEARQRALTGQLVQGPIIQVLDQHRPHDGAAQLPLQRIGDLHLLAHPVRSDGVEREDNDQIIGRLDGIPQPRRKRLADGELDLVEPDLDIIDLKPVGQATHELLSRELWLRNTEAMANTLKPGTERR